MGPRFDKIGNLAAERIGWVVDRGRCFATARGLPARVATLDELLLVVRRDSPLRFDPELGFHLYGADLCLQAAERGLAVVAHRGVVPPQLAAVGLPEGFHERGGVRPQVEDRLPVATPCVIIDEEERVWVLGEFAQQRGDAEPPVSQCPELTQHAGIDRVRTIPVSWLVLHFEPRSRSFPLAVLNQRGAFRS